ncbi:MAG TPA: di-heme oxidoredictase family protein, partial [Polyangiaceae bacterium]|nr:di-heme oxidoredictase family protein [Polyangiaceae bacterium]
AFAGISAFSCSSSADVEATDAAREALLGDALPGTDAATFATARAAFNATEVATDGLGPVFNANACGACHQNGAIGGAGQQIEARYGRLVNGLFDAMASTGGSLRQLFGIGGFNVGPLNCMSGTDANPAPQATIFAGRLTTPLFGLGLVDSLPDARFDALAQREAASIRGVVNRVSTVLPNPLDASQTTGATRVGRFGWKAGVGNLGQFSADAYLNEMGITTTSCIRGQVNSAFATENRANRAGSNAVINGCPDDAVPGIDDSLAAETANCTRDEEGNPEVVNELQDDVALFTFFMAHLSPPPRGAVTAGTAAARGQTLFNSAALQCSGCHRADSDIFVSTSAGGVPAGVVFAPFSDFLLHDMGTLGDGIGNTGDSVAVTRRMRTAPLWGLSSRNKLLHDGRTTNRSTAIIAHDGGANGQGTAASLAFQALSGPQQSDLLAFLDTL